MPRSPTIAAALAAALAAVLGACEAPAASGGGYLEPQPDVTANFGDTRMAGADGAAAPAAALDAGGAADSGGDGGPDAVTGAGSSDATVGDAATELGAAQDVVDTAGPPDAGPTPDSGSTSDAASPPDTADAPDGEGTASDTPADDSTDAGTDGASEADIGPADADAAGDSAGADAEDTATDAGPGPSDATTTGPPAPAAGQLVITELHVNPAAVADADGEWFEVCNVAGKSLSLAGVILGDGTALSDPTKAHAVFAGETLTIPDGGCFVFGAKASTASNGGVEVGYAYNGAFSLNNTGAETVFLRVGATTIDSVSYSPKVNGWPAMPTGATYMLPAGKISATANDSGANWCVSAGAKYGAGDLGTPGKPNGACP